MRFGNHDALGSHETTRADTGVRARDGVAGFTRDPRPPHGCTDFLGQHLTRIAKTTGGLRGLSRQCRCGRKPKNRCDESRSNTHGVTPLEGNPPPQHEDRFDHKGRSDARKFWNLRFYRAMCGP
jgi:hypothetical protein